MGMEMEKSLLVKMTELSTRFSRRLLQGSMFYTMVIVTHNYTI